MIEHFDFKFKLSYRQSRSLKAIFYCFTCILNILAYFFLFDQKLTILHQGILTPEEERFKQDYCYKIFEIIKVKNPQSRHVDGKHKVKTLLILIRRSFTSEKN